MQEPDSNHNAAGTRSCSKTDVDSVLSYSPSYSPSPTPCPCADSIEKPLPPLPLAPPPPPPTAQRSAKGSMAAWHPARGGAVGAAVFVLDRMGWCLAAAAVGDAAFRMQEAGVPPHACAAACAMLHALFPVMMCRAGAALRRCSAMAITAAALYALTAVAL